MFNYCSILFLLFPHLPLKMIPLDSFMAHSADGRLVPVVPGGQNISLTFANRNEYVERALDYRLHEMDSQVLNCWRMIWVYSGDLLSMQTVTHLNIREY